MKKPTIHDVANKANVSVATVSRVINKLGGVKPNTEHDILKAIEELNYVRSAVARSMVRKETKTIGVIVPDILNPFFPEVLAGVEKMANERNYFTLLSSSHGSLEAEKQIIQHFIERGVDGVILTTANEEGSQLKPLIDANIPIVAIDREITKYPVDTVLTGNREGSYQAVKHLIELGHRDIAIITGPLDTTPGRERYKGYQQALKEAGIQVKDDFIGYGNFMENSGYALTNRFYRLEHKPTAIFSCNNLMSMGALKALRNLGWRVSEEVSFIGFDDIEIAAFIDPSLTMVSRSNMSLGSKAFQLLYDRMSDKNVEAMPKREIISIPELVIREASKQDYK